MQHRYAGDIGDFGKYALLKALAGDDLRLGVHWYLNPREERNNDGQFIDYSHLRECDPDLFDELRTILQGQRSVIAIEQARILPARTVFFSTAAPTAKGGGYPAQRAEWNRNAARTLAETGLVFFDPDNGFCPEREQSPGPKHVHPNELGTYLDRDQSVVVYQHAVRTKPLLDLIEEHLRMVEASHGRQGWAVVFRRTSARAYYVFPSAKAYNQLWERTRTFLTSPWGLHFKAAKSWSTRGLRLFQYLAGKANRGDAAGISYDRFLAYLEGHREFREMAKRDYRPSDSTIAIENAALITRWHGRIQVQRAGQKIQAGMDTFIWRKTRPFDRPEEAWKNKAHHVPYTREAWLRVFPDGVRRLISEQELNSLTAETQLLTSNF